jgi:hypothetical protein
MLKLSVQNPVIDDIKLPGFPDSTLQTPFVGSANENALGEAYLSIIF